LPRLRLYIGSPSAEFGVAVRDAVYDDANGTNRRPPCLLEAEADVFPAVVTVVCADYFSGAGKRWANFPTVITTPMFWQAQGVRHDLGDTRANVSVHDRSWRLLHDFRAYHAVICDRERAVFQRGSWRGPGLSQALDDLVRPKPPRPPRTGFARTERGHRARDQNPLNFVTFLRAFSAELTRRLNDVGSRPPRSANIRREVRLTRMLKETLEKGRPARATPRESIVNNTAATERGSGEQRPATISAPLDDRLILPLPAALPRSQGSISRLAKRDFDGRAGAIEIVPQEITRAFLNLISMEIFSTPLPGADGNNASGFEPVLSGRHQRSRAPLNTYSRQTHRHPGRGSKNVQSRSLRRNRQCKANRLAVDHHDFIVKQHGRSI